jgi:hypothetical protein
MTERETKRTRVIVGSLVPGLPDGRLDDMPGGSTDDMPDGMPDDMIEDSTEDLT